MVSRPALEFGHSDEPFVFWLSSVSRIESQHRGYSLSHPCSLDHALCVWRNRAHRPRRRHRQAGVQHRDRRATLKLLLVWLFWFLSRLSPHNEMLAALTFWLAWVNFGLATFNLVPGFPLDGGRIFRALVWGITHSYQRATRLAARSGQFIAYAMILLGSWRALSGNFIGGLWIAFIGWFLLTAAQESVAQMAIRTALAGLQASDVMTHDIPTIGPDISLEEYGQQVLRTGRRCHLVMSREQLPGLMNVHALNSVQRSEWPFTSVQATMIPRAKLLWSTPDQPLLPLLERMLAADVNQVPIMTGAPSDASGVQVLGMVTRDSILRVIQTHIEFHMPAAA